MSTAAAWERFHAGEEPRGVRGEVLMSWRRSRLHGVDPEHVEVPHVETELDSHFVRVATPIMEGMAELLVGDRSCLALADPRGGVVWRWVSEPMLRGTLDRLSVAEGFCWDEEFVGTNGLGSALATGTVAVVRGSEHYAARFHDFTCIAAPVRHPVTRRTVGAVNLTCRAEHTNPLLTVVVRKLVEEIRAALLAQAGARERRLLDEFLLAQRGATGPVLTLGDDVVIANGAALDLGLDHQEIWDGVRGRADGSVVVLPSNLSARLRLVRDGSITTGAVLTVGTTTVGAPAVEPVVRRRAAARAEPDRLVAAAREFLARGPLVVRGEAGTGKTTLLTTVLGGAAVLDAATWTVDGAQWAARLARSGPVVVRHVELLPAEAAPAVAGLLAGRASTGLTLTAQDDTGARPLLDRLDVPSLRIRPLRRRTDEIVGLAQQELRRHDGNLTFAPDARVALRRYGWPGNLRELTRVVRDAVELAHGAVVGLRALPPEVREAAGRRALTPLERAESTVIASVLHECGGNKSAAAKELGISRTALYAKLRSYRL